MCMYDFLPSIPNVAATSLSFYLFKYLFLLFASTGSYNVEFPAESSVNFNILSSLDSDSIFENLPASQWPITVKITENNLISFRSYSKIFFVDQFCQWTKSWSLFLWHTTDICWLHNGDSLPGAKCLLQKQWSACYMWFKTDF